MTDLQNHILFVKEHPFDKVAALALADHFEEASGYSRYVALRKVAAVRRPGRQAKWMAEAAKLMRSVSLTKIELDALLEDQAGLCGYNEYSIFLVNGFQRPTASFDPNEPGTAQWDSPIVTVGARWVIHYYRLLLKIIRKRASLDHFAKHTSRRNSK